MIEIKRDKYSGNGAVSDGSFKRIHEFEALASDYFYTALEERGTIGEGNSLIRVIGRSDVPITLIDCFDSNAQKFTLRVTRPEGEAKVITTVFDMNAKQGAQYQVYDDEMTEDEFYDDLDEVWYQSLGTDWLRELFIPGSAPQYAEIATSGRSDLLNPDNLLVAVGGEFGTNQITPRAKLSKFELTHFNGLLAVYNEVAYDGEPHDDVGSLLQQYYERLKSGGDLGLRTGTKNVRCAKHIVNASIRDDTLTALMYLNYNIPIGGINTYFKEDLVIANEYTVQAQGYFEEEGIAVLQH